MAYNITLQGSNLKEAETLLREVAPILDNNEITYWLEGGTLLGIRREGRLLPWDNDIDISMMSDQLPAISNLVPILKKRGFRVRLRRFSENSGPFKKNTLRMIKIRKQYFFGLIKGKVCLDIFIKYPREDQAYWMIAGKTKAVPLKFYEKFRTISFQGYEFTIPKETEAYLTYRYGDWETPVKDWNTAKDDKALT